jgi:hypothetical protein
MPIFLCRWPNGDCSIVLARNETEAVERLDEVANAEGCPMTRLESLQVHFTLTDDGHLSLDRLGEATEDEIFDFCYPELERASAEGQDTAAGVLRERERVRLSDATTPATELGKRAKEQLDMPTTLVDRIVSRTAKRRLKSFKQRGNPN